MNLGGRIKAEREALGLTQEQLAERAGITGEKAQSLISALEKRDSQRSQYAGALCSALGIELEWGLYGRGPKYRDRIDADRNKFHEPRPAYREIDAAIALMPAAPEALLDLLEVLRDKPESIRHLANFVKVIRS